MEDDGSAEEAAGAGETQPATLPHIDESEANDGAADDVHGAGAKAADQQKSDALSAVLDEVADVFKGGKAGCEGDHGGEDLFCCRFKNEEIKEQRQKLGDFFYNGRDLGGGVERGGAVERGEEGVDIGGKQARSHSRKAKEKEIVEQLTSKYII